jgi:hypothetical protein
MELGVEAVPPVGAVGDLRRDAAGLRLTWTPFPGQSDKLNPTG